VLNKSLHVRTKSLAPMADSSDDENKENSSSKQNRVILKNRENYKDWARRIRAKLDEKDIYTAIFTPDNNDEDAKAYTKNKIRKIKLKAYGLLMAHIDPELSYLYERVDHSDALALWNILETEFAKKDSHKAVAKRKEITQCEMKETETMGHHPRVRVRIFRRYLRCILSV